MKIKVLEIVGLLIMTATVAVFVVSEVTTFWYLINQTTQDTHFGFWQTCNETIADSISSCQSMGWAFFDVSDNYVSWQLMACKVLFLISNGFLGIGFLCLIISLFISAKNRGPSVIAEGCMYLIAGLSGLSGCGVFTIYPTEDIDAKFGTNLWNGFSYSYILGWVASSLALVGGIVVIVAGSKIKSIASKITPGIDYDDE